MSKYEVHTVDTAPEASKPLLQNLHNAMGMIPNLAASMSESPELLKGFLTIREIFYGGSFTPAEIQVLALTNAFENGCRYCMALHSSFALKAGVSKETVTALRTGRSPREPRLGALSEFSRTLVKHRGHVRGDDLQRFITAGYSKGQALEVVLGVAVSILPNFAHHITQCAIDAVFDQYTWTTTEADAQATVSS
jgi:AhpD family alkylhydroperoxidase